MRKTKIIATLGPASCSYKIIKSLVKTGVNVFRLNFSHGTYKSFTKIISSIKRARKVLSRPVAIMQDLQGPKIRISAPAVPFTVKRGDELIISEKPVKKRKWVSVDVDELYKYVKPKNIIMINDGLIQLRVRKIERKKERIICYVAAGGEITARKGVNLPGIILPFNAVTKKDEKDLRFGLKNGVDIVSLSFVRSADDIKHLKNFYKKKKNPPLIIAKIEKPEAVKDIKSILDISDGIMIARGDLAVEAGYKPIPYIQKNLIKISNSKSKIVIVATQMLESMINSPFPQRAEITDIYNAVLDGADTLMLSGETSIGKYPVKTVRVMSDIINKAEKNLPDSNGNKHRLCGSDTYSGALAVAATAAASCLNRCVIAVAVNSIGDISSISDYRPHGPVAAVVKEEGLFHKLSILNGIYPVLTELKDTAAAAAVSKIFRKTTAVIYADFHKNNTEQGKIVIHKMD
ncbi:MAG TPA: pyruvate kinase [bacterium]|nr:pyruvate kinase [bacterium]